MVEILIKLTSSNPDVGNPGGFSYFATLLIGGSLESPQCLLLAFAPKFWEVVGTYE